MGGALFPGVVVVAPGDKEDWTPRVCVAGFFPVLAYWLEAFGTGLTGLIVICRLGMSSLSWESERL